MMTKGITMKRICAALLTAAWIGVLSGAADAAGTNPYTNVKALTVSGQEEAAYIDQKMTEFFRPVTSAGGGSGGYEAPAPWQEQNLVFDSVPVLKYTNPKGRSDRTVLFLHGGGYIGGLHGRYLDWGLHQGDLADAGTLFAVDYRLAPEHTYPAALEDAVTAYRAILKEGTDPQQIVLVGDSAGGNLAAALLLSLRDNKMPLPKAAILISPWGYLGSDLPSHMNNIPKDQVLGAKNVRLGGEVAHPSYRKDAPVTDPYISPVYADLTGLPPMLITAGGDELFLDDAALLAAHATAAGVPVQFTIYPRMSHDWTLLLPELPESAAMDAEIRQFVDAQLKR